MNFEARRNAVIEQMDEQSILVLYSGTMAAHFEVNHHFFYLTGLTRSNMILVLSNLNGKAASTLYIEKCDPAAERWTGKMVTVEEAKAVSQVEDIRFVERLDADLNMLAVSTGVKNAYFDLYRFRKDAMPSFNIERANAFAAAYPGITLRNLWPLVSKLRMSKDADEEVELRKAIEVTNVALQNVMANLKPGRMEYQVQADFEYMVKFQGAESLAFSTIAGSGRNGTMLHYGTNRDECKDESLVLLDLGAKWNGYCADITRTYPVNGKFTERQRKVYDIVLKANRTIARTAKPGMTTVELNEVCKQVLAEGCIELGLIKDASEIRKYYMHGVSHHLGIDVHDVTLPGSVLTVGSVISDEPGLYIDEWDIGIRIEDDIMITEDGCKVLSEQVIRDPDEIEAFMAQAKKN